MHHILVIQRDSTTVETIRQNLSHLQIEIAFAPTLEKANTALLSSKHRRLDLVLSDTMVDDGEIFDFLSTLMRKSDFHDVPVLIYSNQKDLPLKVAAFSMGIADYITRDMHPMEIAARIENSLRRSERSRKASDTIQLGRLVLHMPLLRAYVRGDNAQSRLDLTAKEFRILSFLTLHAGQVFSRHEIVHAIWGDSVHVLSRTVDSHICSLRRKLGALGHYIESIPSAGYRLNAPQEEIAAGHAPAPTSSDHLTFLR